MKDFLVSVLAFITSVGVHNPLAGARANARGQGQRQGQACGQGGLRQGGICLDLSLWVFWMGSVYQDRTLTIIIWSLLISSDLFWQVFWVPLNDLPVTLVSLLVLPTKLHLYAWVYTLWSEEDWQRIASIAADVLVVFVVQCVFQKMSTTGIVGKNQMADNGICLNALNTWKQGWGGYECVQEFSLYRLRELCLRSPNQRRNCDLFLCDCEQASRMIELLQSTATAEVLRARWLNEALTRLGNRAGATEHALPLSAS